MPNLDDITQKILIDGDAEVINKLSEIGEKGFEAIKELSEAAESGASGLEIFGTAIGEVGATIIGVVGAISAFVDANDEAIQRTNFLAQAFGATTEQVVGLEAAFAAAGVSTRTFEQFAQRLTTTIAREWPAITESIRTSSNEQDAAQERVVSSTIKVQEAQRALGFVNDETASKIANSSLRAQAAYTALQFAASHALQQIQHDTDSVRGADLSLESAQQRLAELEGRPVSEADKQALQIREAQLAVDKARQAAADARIAQQEHAAQAAAKQAQLEQAAEDAALKHETAISEAATSRQKAEEAVRSAITARAEAEDRAQQIALKSIPAIKSAIEGLTDGSKAATTAIDLTQVSVTNLTKGIIAAAQVGDKPPTGFQVMVELSRVLSSEQGKLIDSSQKLAIVQQLSQRGFSTTSGAAFELLNALERGPEYFKRFENAAKSHFSVNEQGRQNVEHFRDAIAALGQSIELVNRDFAAAASPIFTSFLEALNESLTTSDGLLHAVVAGVQAIGAGLGVVIEGYQKLATAIDHAFNLEPGRAMQALIGAAITAVALFASAWLAVPAAIAVVVTAIGYIAENWDKVREGAARAWEAVTNSSVVKFLESVLEEVKAIWSFLSKIVAAANTLSPISGKSGGASAGAGGSESGAQGFAEGGPINGPGTTTSDSILARLSRGEFVIKAAAVQTYGAGLFHALNNMMLPGFASGGLVPSPVRLPGGGSVPATSTLNLSIDGRSFNGLRGPKSTIDDLSSFAIARQTSAAGSNPSWMK